MKKQISIVAAVVLTGACAFAQESLTQDAAVSKAVESNRELAAARVRVEEAKARLQQKLEQRFREFESKYGDSLPLLP